MSRINDAVFPLVQPGSSAILFGSIAEHLADRFGTRRVFAAAIGMRRVDFAVAKWDPFLNVNTPEDLTLARAIAEAD